jgi:phospholipase C
MSNQLNQIDHIVVLMLENRSFDHMLGYLSLEGGRQDVDGLTGNEVNFHDEQEFRVQRMSSPIMNGDPCHEWDCVKEQLDNDNGGFVSSYAKHVASHPEFVMNYFNAADLPVYDHLAREFTICDRWFCSIPGPTQPNRAYALAGTSEGIKNNFSPKELALNGGWNALTIFEQLPKDVSWRCYSHDISGLRFFKKFKKSLVPEIDKIDKFFEAAREGALPNVSWIDPDFGMAIYPGPPNDDHPPHDVRHAQNLVSAVYNALLTAGNALWMKTLLVVTYDEHGGFYDHVSPRQFKPADTNGEDFRQYGPRVPAFIVSPWAVRQRAYGSQSHDLEPGQVVFDHTSILRTILRRFCTPAGGQTPGMTTRIDAANDLSVLLTEQHPRNDCTPAPSIPNVPVSLKDIFLMDKTESDLQEQLQQLADEAKANGVPPNKL